VVDGLATHIDHLDSHPTRYAKYLFGEFSGISKLISVIKSALGFTIAGLPNEHPNIQSLKAANTALGDTKTGVNVIRVLKDFPSVHRKYVKAGASCQKIYRKWSRGEQIEVRDVVRVATLVGMAAKKTLSMIGDGIVAPLKLVSRYANMGEGVHAITSDWQYVGAVKSGLKISTTAGRLFLGTKKTVCRVIELIFEIVDLSVFIFSKCCSSVHPSVTLTLSGCKSIYGLYEVYRKTL
jgi:hypothetical protein